MKTKRKRLEWVVKSIISACGGYCITHSEEGWFATPIDLTYCPFLFKSFKTKREAIAACERHAGRRSK